MFIMSVGTIYYTHTHMHWCSQHFHSKNHVTKDVLDAMKSDKNIPIKSRMVLYYMMRIILTRKTLKLLTAFVVFCPQQ